MPSSLVARRPEIWHVDVMRQPQVVAFSPHPDDSEIGAAGLIHRAVGLGWDVRCVVMTDEDDPSDATRRRAESLEAMEIIGLPATSILFAGFPDRGLTSTGATQGALRRVLDGLEPDLVIVNHHAEKHSDHRATSNLVENVLAGVPMLEYVVGNHVDPGRVAPTVFVELDDHLLDMKLRALAAHASQVDQGRIDAEEYLPLWKSFAAEVGLTLAEPFEARNFDRDAYAMVGPVNSSLFERFWLEAVATDHLTVIHDHLRHPAHRDALDDLRVTFKVRRELPLLTTRYAEDLEGGDQGSIGSGSVLLVGGPFGQSVADRLFDELTGGGLSRLPGSPADPLPSEEAIFSVMPKPTSTNGLVMAAAGRTPDGTAALLRLLMRPTKELFDTVSQTSADRRPRRCVFEIAHGTDMSPSCVVVETVVG
jgi:LmbE family N-acetylglucosaminyl deacetylase